MKSKADMIFQAFEHGAEQERKRILKIIAGFKRAYKVKWNDWHTPFSSVYEVFELLEGEIESNND
jgi:hypothetical protein